MRDDDGFPLFISNKLLSSFCFSLKLFRQLTKLPKKRKLTSFCFTITICIKMLKLADKTDLWGHF